MVRPITRESFARIFIDICSYIVQSIETQKGLWACPKVFFKNLSGTFEDILNHLASSHV